MNENELIRKSEELIPCQSQTFSKGPDYYIRGVYPLFIDRGYGASVFDLQGKEYTDYILGLGPITIGYDDPDINDAIITQLLKGITFPMPSPLEVHLAEVMSEIIPCAEMVRFSKTGSEVCSAAVRLARAYTGKEKVLHWGYHGWHDWYATKTDRNKGVPEFNNQLIEEFEYNNIDDLEKKLIKNRGNVAAVMMEPMTFTWPNEGYLEAVVRIAHHYGAIVIFDEMVTGFRWDLGGAQEYFGVTPDLATFGKGIANGMPLTAVVGKKEIMKECEEIFFSTTFGGECLSLAAAIATIDFMKDAKTQNHFRHLGKHLQIGLWRLKNGIDLTGYYGRPMLTMENETPEMRHILMQELCKRGILVHSGPINFCHDHDFEDIDNLLNAIEDIKKKIDAGQVEVEGVLKKMSFRRL